MGSKSGAEKSRAKLKQKLGDDAHKIIGSKGGSVSSPAKKEAARLREVRKRQVRERTL